MASRLGDIIAKQVKDMIIQAQRDGVLDAPKQHKSTDVPVETSAQGGRAYATEKRVHRSRAAPLKRRK